MFDPEKVTELTFSFYLSYRLKFALYYFLKLKLNSYRRKIYEHCAFEDYGKSIQ